MEEVTPKEPYKPQYSSFTLKSILNVGNISGIRFSNDDAVEHIVRDQRRGRFKEELKKDARACVDYACGLIERHPKAARRTAIALAIAAGIAGIAGIHYLNRDILDAGEKYAHADRVLVEAEPLDSIHSLTARNLDNINLYSEDILDYQFRQDNTNDLSNVGFRSPLPSGSYIVRDLRKKHSPSKK